MKIAGFYENIETGAEAKGISMTDAVSCLMAQGLELLYIGGATLNEKKDQVLQLLEDTGIGVEGIHAWIDYTSGPRPEETARLIADAVQLKANNILIVPGMVKDETKRERIIANIVAGMMDAIRQAQGTGIPVSMEDFDGLESPYNSIAGLAHFMQEVPGLQCSFDTGNFIMHHEDEKKAYDLFRERICTMHLKDRKKERKWTDEKGKACADGEVLYVAPIGQGCMKIEEMLADLKATNYQGNVIVELYDYSPEHMLEGFIESIRWIHTRK